MRSKRNHGLFRQHGMQLRRQRDGFGYCDYAQTNYDCDGTCLNDADADGICDEFEVAGCTTPSTCNFDASATENDGSCVFPDPGTIATECV